VKEASPAATKIRNHVGRPILLHLVSSTFTHAHFAPVGRT